MSTATRTVSETYKSADADIILISSEYVQSPSARLATTLTDAERCSNHSYAVHKANLSRSPVFRDMFEMVPAGNQSATDGTTGNDAERASKRTKLVGRGDSLPEIQMHETRELLDLCLPLFYGEDEPNFMSDPLEDTGDMVSRFGQLELLAAAQFYRQIRFACWKSGPCDYFSVRDFPIRHTRTDQMIYRDRIAAVERVCARGSNDKDVIEAALIYFFVAAHFKIRRSRQDALRILMRLASFEVSPAKDNSIENLASKWNVFCFGDAALVSRLVSQFPTSEATTTTDGHRSR